ncbi:hypothetical protein ACGFSD_12040 [Streptomyces caniferus]|uniref:hypothetical protein n=1 Tax=Streptomyces caniferus TaxID=285557 RepID=UPI00371F6EEC
MALGVARARRLAGQATRAAEAAQTNARQAAVAARQSRNAANDAAAHAEAAAKAADKAADEAGRAVNAAKESTDAANAATTAANDSQTAADQARSVAELARKADTERLTEQQEENVLAAEESKKEHDARVSAAEWEIGRAQQLNTATEKLREEATTASDPQVMAAKGRRLAVKLLTTGGTWTRTAAAVALEDTDPDVVEFVRTGLTVAMEQDDRASAGHIAATSDKPAQQEAALAVMDKPIAQVREFLRTRAYPGKEHDDRIAVSRIMEASGPGVKAAANKALDGSAADVDQFLETGQYKARESDERVAVSQAMAVGDPEVKAAAQAALSGPPSELHEFLQVGLYRAQQRDANAAAHTAEIDILLAGADRSAALAHKDAAQAQRVAADARDEATEAVKWADKARKSAEKADTYAKQADKSADQAADSAKRAAESARSANSAAASARKDAQAATHSAAQAQHSATIATAYSYQANNSAYQAHVSAETAGKDATAAAKASAEAMKTAADLLVSEMKAQIQDELLKANKPLSDSELRKAVEKHLVKYRRSLLGGGELKPGHTLLVCGGDGAGGMGCITSTYLDRLIAWYVGADEIEQCLQKANPSCFKGLALNALKLKILKKSRWCRTKAGLAPRIRGSRSSATGQGDDSPKVFENRIPSDTPEWFKPIAPGTALSRSGNYAYVVLENGELVIGKRTAGNVSIARGQKVLAAGEFKTKGGEVVFPDNKSGHYRPYGSHAEQAAVDAFNRNGMKADGQYNAAWGCP